jgi:hypothetical protein
MATRRRRASAAPDGVVAEPARRSRSGQRARITRVMRPALRVTGLAGLEVDEAERQRERRKPRACPSLNITGGLCHLRRAGSAPPCVRRHAAPDERRLASRRQGPASHARPPPRRASRPPVATPYRRPRCVDAPTAVRLLEERRRPAKCDPAPRGPLALPRGASVRQPPWRGGATRTGRRLS